MRLLVTGAGGLVGSNLAAAAAQQSWSVLGSWRRTPVSVLGARTVQLDVADRHACVALAEEFEPDVIVHAAAEGSPARLEREPNLAELNLLGVESTLAAARAVRARHVLVSCDLVFSGMRPSAECWDEEDVAQPVNALGRSLLACERLVQRSSSSWLITRPADVYGVNLSIPAAPSALGAREQWEPVGGHGLAANGNGAGWATLAARARHVWERSGAPLRWVAWLRAGQPLAAPPSIRRSPTYAWDYAQCVCELIAQECEGTYHMGGPTILGRLAHLRLVARAFNCNMRLVQEGSPAAFLHASEGGAPDGIEADPAAPVPMPANTALCDRKASFMLGRTAVDPFAGHRLMRRQLEQVLSPPTPADQPPSPPLAPPVAPSQPISVQALG
jgi:dTDP-4-dehydrorhamnose reductase